MKTVTVNAVGEQCPIPVIKATKALNELKEAGVVEVVVDNETAVENLTRLASSRGLSATRQKQEENRFVVTIGTTGETQNKGESCEAAECILNAKGDFVVAIGADTMGNGDDKLGATLIKGFIFAVSQLEVLPKAILFYNGGAKLTAEGSLALEDLKNMEEQGVEILTCGTCLNFYGLSDKLAVGSVTNMYSIVEKLTAAAKVVRP